MSESGDEGDDVNLKRVEPLFFLNSEVDQTEKYLDTYEICKAVNAVVGNAKLINGAQRIGGLWRIYFNYTTARAQVLCTGIDLRDTQVTLKDKNPFLYPGHELVETTRLYIRNIPLSYDNDIISNSLKEMGVKTLGILKYVRARTPDGQLTNFKTGDRFVDIVVPPEPLPKKKQMGLFTAPLYHREQRQTLQDVECGNCKQKGHVRKNCKNEAVCYECLRPGHKKGSPMCEGAMIDASENENKEILNSQSEGEESEDGGKESGEESGNESGEDTSEENVKDKSELESKKAGDSAGGKPEVKESAEQTAKKLIIAKMWAAAPKGDSGTPAVSRGASPARVRKAVTYHLKKCKKSRKGQKKRKNTTTKKNNN